MEQIRDFWRKGIISQLALVAGAVFGVFTLFGILVVPSLLTPVADMRIEPQHAVAEEGNEFTVRIVVESGTPVNVFAGELTFDSSVIEVVSIDYNTSIADLWAERPWYSNGDGTLNFIGGTTRSGGFLGTGTLITIHFRTLREGQGVLALHDTAILEHDGLGTYATLEEPIDAVVTVEAKSANMLQTTNIATTFEVVREVPSTDLNGDGKQSLADISIFMLNITSKDTRFDFNLDGAVNTKDLSILLDAK